MFCDRKKNPKNIFLLELAGLVTADLDQVVVCDLSKLLILKKKLPENIFWKKFSVAKMFSSTYFRWNFFSNKG